MPTAIQQTVTAVNTEVRHAPELRTTDDGLQCTSCGALNDFVEVEFAVRENTCQVTLGDFGIIVTPEPRDAQATLQTAHWRCRACNLASAMPLEVDVVYS